MNKKSNQEVFLSESPIVAIGTKRLSSIIHKYEEETLRKVKVEILPLDWVYETKKTYSELFKLFGKYNEKFLESFLLEVMFDKFWPSIQNRIIGICFLPYFAYFMLAQAYFIFMPYKKGEQAVFWGFREEDLGQIEQIEWALPPFVAFFLIYHCIQEVD